MPKVPDVPTCHRCKAEGRPMGKCHINLAVAFEKKGCYAILLFETCEGNKNWDGLADEMALEYGWDAVFLCPKCLRKLVLKPLEKSL